MSKQEERERFEQRKSSIAAYKGHLTRSVKDAQVLTRAATDNPSTDLYKELKEELKVVKTRFNKTEETIIQLGKDFRGEEVQQYIKASLDGIYEDYEDARGRIFEALNLLEPEYGELKKKDTAITIDPATVGASSAHLEQALRPEVLSHESQPSQVRNWIEDFQAYFLAAKLNTEPDTVQQSVFLRLLDNTIRSRIEPLMTPRMDVLDEEDGCLGLLKEDFLLRIPLFIRRCDYFGLTQQSNQSATSFFRDLQSREKEADAVHLRPDEIYIHRYISGLRDKNLRGRLIKIQNIDRKTLETEVLNYDAGQATQERLDGVNKNAHVKRSGGVRNKKKQSHKGKSKSNAEAIVTLDELKGKCLRCGKDHKTKTCYLAKHPDKISCRNCGKKGHLQKVCLGGKFSVSRANSRAPSPNSGAESNTIICSAAYQGKNIPKCEVYIQDKSRTGKKFKTTILPDSGSMRSILPLSLARHNRLRIRNSNERLIAANSTDLEVDGQVDVIIKYGTVETSINALVSSSVKEPIVAWFDLQALKILPKDFPKQISNHNIQMSPELPQLSKNVKNSDGQVTNDFQTEIDELCNLYVDVISDKLHDKPIAGPAVRIHLRKGATPRRILGTRPIPINQEPEARKILNDLVETGVIAKLEEPTDWLSPAFFLEKPGGGLRLVTDFTASGLNEVITRNVHPFPSSSEVQRKIHPDSRFFAKLDCIQGYHQLALDEDSQKLTAFVTPLGSYYYKRVAMGMAMSGDEFCRKTDPIIEDVPLSTKIVDDILLQGKTMDELRQRIKDVLEKCRQYNIIISKRKFTIGTSIEFAGFCVSADGISPDPEKVKAIREFPTPNDITSLRSFLGLAQQLASFVPDLAHCSGPLRTLLKKDTQWIWLKDHDDAFKKTKEVLTGTKLIQPFDTNLPTVLLTDASRTKGLGFALIQTNDDGFNRLICCGSRGLSSTESRYATIELELQAVVYAVEKSYHYLRGLKHFTVMSDHRPLVGLFKKRLDEISNRRLQRQRLRLADYCFELVYTPGKSHHIADALSRSPVFDPPEDIEQEGNTISHVCVDKSLQELKEKAKQSIEYQQVVKAVLDDKDPRNLPLTHPAREFRSVFHDLGFHDDLLIFQGQRIVIPRNFRKEILEKLHLSHSGVTKSKLLARQAYYWPGMNRDIESTVADCADCRKFSPTQQQETLIPSQPTGPMEFVGIDLFHIGTNNYVVMKDGYSGFLFVDKLTKLTTAHVLSKIEKHFNVFGIPNTIRSDGGPQFRKEFDEFCADLRITHEQSSPYHPRSNGLAESAVKSAKRLLQKSHEKFDIFQRNLLEYHNVPREDTKLSPAAMIFGRPCRTRLPTLPAARKPVGEDTALQAKKNAVESMKDKHDQHAKDLPPLKIGDSVDVQNPFTKLWDSQGTVKEVRRGKRSYIITSDAGRFKRNRKFLRPRQNHEAMEFDEFAGGDDPGQTLRRSERLRQKKSVCFRLSN